MKILNKYILAITLILSLYSCEDKTSPDLNGIQIAFMADVHLQDLYGDFQDNDYKGVKNPVNGKYTLARTMEAQLNSTRLFNENYFAFLAALDDVVKRGVKYVVLPGDFSDDGQPFNVRGIKKILDQYSEKHGIIFLATTGNHDPVRPFKMEAGKKDFLGEGGKLQPIMSKEGLYTSDTDKENPVIITKDIHKMGYQGIVTMLTDYGFFPNEEYLYWETPFSDYRVENYNFSKALEESSMDKRNYSIPPFNTSMPDVSYLVEPVEGLWLLTLDANVYIPKNQARINPKDPGNYSGASVGYNHVLTHKKHLIQWVKNVSQRAEENGKTLIAFSHYPIVEFNDDATPQMEKLFGSRNMQSYRVPSDEVAEIFADAGIQLHFAGHMHINDTGVRKSKSGNTLVNVQVPSLAAYIPAYKLLTFRGNNLMEVETIVMDTVSRFNELFPLYEMEYNHLIDVGAKNVWNKEILSAKTYREFTDWHLKELVRKRIIKKQWPEDFRDFLVNSSGKELADHFQVQETNHVTDLTSWTGFDMILDLYRLRGADRLALKDIGMERVKQYQLIVQTMLEESPNKGVQYDSFREEFIEFAKILDKLLKGAPADHFYLNTETGVINQIKNPN